MTYDKPKIDRQKTCTCTYLNNMAAGKIFESFTFDFNQWKLSKLTYARIESKM